MSRNVVVVTNIPRPYRLGLFRVLGDQLASLGGGLRILYTSDPSKHVRRGSSPIEVGDPSVESYVRGVSLQPSYEQVITIPTGLSRALGRCNPACVVAPGFGLSTMVVARWCNRTRVPYLIWSGAWPGGDSAIGFVRSTVRRRLVRGARAFVAYGSAAADYLVALGAPSDKIFCAWNTVDLEDIASTARTASNRRAQLTAKFSLAKRNLLFVGSLVQRKGLDELVAAALAIGLNSDDWALHLVGAGPLRERLEAAVQAAGKEANFRFHGFRPPMDVAELLGLVDGLILPTRVEAWGLVINEAMACGVPVVASSRAGATRDLIVDEVTGFVVDPWDGAKLGAIMSRLIAADPKCLAVGRAGAEAIRAKASIEKSAGGFVCAVQCALAGESLG